MKIRIWICAATALSVGVFAIPPLADSAAPAQPGAALSSWGPASVSGSSQNFCLASSGNAYVLQREISGASSILEATASGSATIPVDSSDATLTNASAIGCYGSNVYVAIPGGTIYEIPMSGGSATTPYATSSTAFNPGGIVFSTSGAMYISASDQSAIYSVASGGGATNALNASGLATNGMSYLTMSGSILFIAGSTTGQFFSLPVTGGEATAITMPENSEPSGIAVDPGGNIWVSDLNNNDFVIFDPSLSSSFTVTATGPSGILLQGPGGLYWTNNGLLTENINQSEQPLLAAAVTVYPTPPLNVQVTSISSTKATVSWGIPLWNGNSDITSYTATVSPGGGTCVSTGPRSCSINGLSANTTYSVTVTATNSGGPSSPSTPSVLFTTLILAATGVDLGLLGELAVLLFLLGGTVALLKRRRTTRRLNT